MPSKLVELEIARPGVFGVNSAASGDIMPKEYSVKSHNIVFSEEGYPEARRGSQRLHASALTGETVRQIYTTPVDGDSNTIFSTETKIYRKPAGAPVDITGTLTTPTAGNWKFVNLNDEVFCFQLGHVAGKLSPIDTGTFVNATFTGTEAPTGSGTAVTDALAAFGRLWLLEGDTLRYSSLLLPEDFDPTGGDAGFFNLRATMLSGSDKPVALAEFNGNLIVLNQNSVTVWAYPFNPNATSGTEPMQVIETIGGVGCIARDSVQHTQNDLVFLSEQGITSLSRVVQEKSMPIQRHSDNIRKEVLDMIRSGTMENIWSAYVPANGMYMFGSADDAYSFMIDLKAPLPDGSYRATMWFKLIKTMSVIPQEDLLSSDEVWNSLYIADEEGYLSQVRGFNDYTPSSGVGGDSYLLTYESAWTAIIDELENNIKIPKKVGVVIKGTGEQPFTINLAFDYGDFISSKAKGGVASLSFPSNYNVATYINGTYGGGQGIRQTNVPGFGAGRIMKVLLTSTVNGDLISIQRISIKSKIGKQG